MSEDIYATFFEESTKSQSQLSCQYVECGKPLDRNGKFCNLTCCNRENARRQKIKADQRRRDQEISYNQNPKHCLECKCAIAWGVTLNGPAKFCGHSCATKFNNRLRSKESRQKQTETLKNTIRERGVTITKSQDGSNTKKTVVLKLKYPYTPITWKTCPLTGKPYHTRRMGKQNCRQSPYLADIKTIYYKLCRFKFNVYKMPEIFDLDLLDKFGWYTCPGKKRAKYAKNVNGVSRDHLYSVSIGMSNKIHPLILSHPVNCQLLQHKDNKRKHNDCAITLEELVSRIQAFDNSANVFPGHHLIARVIKDNQIIITDWEELRKFV